MISRAAHAGQILTLWLVLGTLVWLILTWAERVVRLLALSWADVHEWTETGNPAERLNATTGLEAHPEV